MSYRTVLELLTLGDRTLPSSLVPIPTLPGWSTVVAHASHPLQGHGSAIYKGSTISIDAGTGFSLNGSADLGALGEFRLNGVIQGVGLIASGRATGEMTLSDAHGTITLARHGRVQSAFSPVPGELVYSVNGGTVAFRHLTGYGTIGMKLWPAPIAFGQPPTGRVELTFG